MHSQGVQLVQAVVEKLPITRQIAVLQVCSRIKFTFQNPRGNAVTCRRNRSLLIVQRGYLSETFARHAYYTGLLHQICMRIRYKSYLKIAPTV